MKKIIVAIALIVCVICIGSIALGNPGMLPQHPGYPMADTKDPVKGVRTANDPGRTAPPPEEALEQAGKFHDSHAMNTTKEYRPNVIHEEVKEDSKASK